MNKIKFLFAFFLLMWILSACGGAANNSAVNKNSVPGPEAGNQQPAGSGTLNPYPANVNSNANPAGKAPEPSSFWFKAAQAGTAEVELSRLAQSNAENADVKQFAQQMVLDHSKAGNELKALATNKDIAPPSTMDTKHEELRSKLSDLKGADFDKLYVSTMVQDHQEAVSLFKTASQSEKDPDVKAWATQTLPALQGHLDKIKQIQANLNKAK